MALAVKGLELHHVSGHYFGLGNVARALTTTGNVQDLAPVLLGDPDFCG